MVQLLGQRLVFYDNTGNFRATKSKIAMFTSTQILKNDISFAQTLSSADWFYHIVYNSMFVRFRESERFNEYPEMLESIVILLTE